MSKKKVKSKSKVISKGKAKKAAPAKKNVKKASAKSTGTKKKKPAKKVVSKKVAPKKKISKPAKVKVAKKAKAVKVTKKAAVKNIKQKAKAAPSKEKNVTKTVVTKSPAKEIKQVKKPVAAPVQEKKPDTAKDNMQYRPPAARPLPVNRRPEPARAIISKSKPQEETGKNRYSDKELEEFREIINRKLEEARKELAILQAQMTAANEHGTDDTASTFKILEDGSDSLAKEEAGQLASRQKKFIEQLENAMVRIENKTYGICRVTGKLIPKERLRAVPHTTQSIEAKLNQYRD